MQLVSRFHRTSRLASLLMVLRYGREGSGTGQSWSLQTRLYNCYRGGPFSPSRVAYGLILRTLPSLATPEGQNGQTYDCERWAPNRCPTPR